MQQKKIIVFSVVLFILGCAYLFRVSDIGRNPDMGKNWWVIYFEDPKGNGLNFAIENHSDRQDFRWEVSVDQEKRIEESAMIGKGETRNISVPLDNLENKKVVIDVFSGDGKKEIYKNF